MIYLQIIALVLTLSVATTSALESTKYKIPNEAKEKESSYWFTLMKNEIDFAANRRIIDHQAKNVILFLGDGMGITATTAGRIFKGQKKGYSGEEEFLTWEKFPNVAMSKTYNIDKQVADSAASATAFLCGVKANYYTIGVSGNVMVGDCPASLQQENRVDSILKWFQDAGKDTGFVTTTRITHATPAGLYAHTAHREWECDQFLHKSDNDTTGCKDVARQLVEDDPGRGIHVILGGGRRQFGASVEGDEGKSCLRNDSRNLVEEWLQGKRQAGNTARYVTNTEQLRALNLQDVDFVMGLFGGSHLPFAFERDASPEGTPTLKELTEVAIKRLRRNPRGFFLLVEGGRIDHALHDTKPRIALEELLALEEAVEAAVRLTDVEETLMVVTADHSHVMTINGYPDRGNDILGKTMYKDVTDGMPYTTLMFTTGNATNFTSVEGGKVVRSNLTGIDTRDHHFMPLAAVPTKMGSETHGGEDVGVYAIGPQAHLFHSVHEQSYIAHVMAYAACVGPYQYDCSPSEQPSSAVHNAASHLTATLNTAILWTLVLRFI